MRINSDALKTENFDRFFIIPFSGSRPEVFSVFCIEMLDM